MVILAPIQPMAVQSKAVPNNKGAEEFQALAGAFQHHGRLLVELLQDVGNFFAEDIQCLKIKEGQVEGMALGFRITGQYGKGSGSKKYIEACTKLSSMGATITLLLQQAANLSPHDDSVNDFIASEEVYPESTPTFERSQRLASLPPAPPPPPPRRLVDTGCIQNQVATISSTSQLPQQSPSPSWESAADSQDPPFQQASSCNCWDEMAPDLLGLNRLLDLQALAPKPALAGSNSATVCSPKSLDAGETHGRDSSTSAGEAFEEGEEEVGEDDAPALLTDEQATNENVHESEKVRELMKEHARGDADGISSQGSSDTLRDSPVVSHDSSSSGLSVEVAASHPPEESWPALPHAKARASPCVVNRAPPQVSLRNAPKSEASLPGTKKDEAKITPEVAEALLRGKWLGDKAESYEISFESTARWTCWRTDSISSKAFPLRVDWDSGLVTWGKSYHMMLGDLKREPNQVVWTPCGEGRSARMKYKFCWQKAQADRIRRVG